MSEKQTSIFPWPVVDSPDRGTMQPGVFQWDDPLFDGIEWPYFAIHGAQPGPAAVVIAGVHGGEYPGILAAQRVARNIEPAELKGSLLILPILNPPSFWERSAFVSPADGQNLNRVFPGNVSGTYSERLAYYTLRDIIQPTDILIDLHSGDVFEALASHVGGYVLGDSARDDLTKDVITAFGLPYVWLDELGERRTSLTAASTGLGKHTIFVEVGGNALFTEQEVEQVTQGIMNALVVYGLLEVDLPISRSKTIYRAGSVTSPCDGLWLPTIVLEQHVEIGELLGRMTDALGEEISQIRAEVAGMVLYHMTSLAVRQGDPLVALVTVS
ncbi:MAG: succinylglutamate desuccinylase/aspartoacylase family protein [Chloroflexia bacterium]|nr:succinylglutamate desuccinylase/aspartoacylase family protein [Chloroflexia bacterium]